MPSSQSATPGYSWVPQVYRSSYNPPPQGLLPPDRNPGRKGEVFPGSIGSDPRVETEKRKTRSLEEKSTIATPPPGSTWSLEARRNCVINAIDTALPFVVARAIRKDDGDAITLVVGRYTDVLERMVEHRHHTPIHEFANQKGRDFHRSEVVLHPSPMGFAISLSLFSAPKSRSRAARLLAHEAGSRHARGAPSQGNSTWMMVRTLETRQVSLRMLPIRTEDIHDSCK